MSNNHDLLNNAIKIDETMHDFQFQKEYETVNYNLFTELKENLDSFVNNRDEYKAYFIEKDNEDISTDLKDIADETDLVQFESNVILSITIKKSVVNHKLSIYNITSFDRFLQNRTMVELISIWNRMIVEENVNHFEVLYNSNLAIFRSKTFLISGENVNIKLYENNTRRNKLNRFYDISQMNGYNDAELIPNDFHNLYEGSNYSGITSTMEVCKRFFALAYIVNLTNSVDSNMFQVEVRSKERHKENIRYEDLLTSRYEKAYDIYEWIYSETLVDKAQIVRYFMIEDSDSNILLDKSVLSSSIEAYSQFINKELDKFIDVQDKALLAIQDNKQKFRELRNNVVSIFKTSSFTMLGFFISNFLVKHVSSSDKLVEELVKKIRDIYLYYIYNLSVANNYTNTI